MESAPHQVLLALDGSHGESRRILSYRTIAGMEKSVLVARTAVLPGNGAGTVRAPERVLPPPQTRSLAGNLVKTAIAL
eukprot:12934157-Prorocentrum_lima.AAC.1